MRASDIVTQLAILLPQLSDKFTRNVGIRSMTRSGTVMTIQCDDDHNVKVGDSVAIANAKTNITGSHSRVGTVGTFVADGDFDPNNLKFFPTVIFSGATEAEFNGTFTVSEWTNRRTVTYVIADAGPTVSSGAPIMHNSASPLQQYDGTYRVGSTPSDSSLTITQPDTGLSDPVGTIQLRAKPRISASVDPVRAVEAYTEKNVGEYWLFVSLNEAFTSKSRNVRSDAHDNLVPGDNFRQQVTQPFTLFLFVPAQTDLGDADARDEAEDMFTLLSQCVLGTQFDSGLSVGKQGYTVFVTHGTFSDNTAVYVHAYNYQQTSDLYQGDTVGPALDVAFRNLSLSMDPELPGSTNTTALTLAIDLDETPL